MKRPTFFSLLLCLLLAAQCQLPTANCQSPIAERILKNYWAARWIVCPETSPVQYGVFHFRKTFELPGKPASFVVHVSADNRYRLFVNGTPICSGPARSDLAHWNFETIDLAPYLNSGKNVLAALVWNAAEHKPFAQISYQTGFILQGNTQAEDLVNTNNSWKVLKNEAYQPLPVTGLRTYIVTGAGDRVDGSRYPWGWEQPAFEDAGWQQAEQLWFVGKPRTMGTDGNWMLVPREIPLFPEEKLGKADISRAGVGVFAPGKERAPVIEKLPVILPPFSKTKILFDQQFLVNAYPELLVSGGKGSSVRLTYAEALFDKDRKKGNRNEVKDKEIQGVQDVFLPDGGYGRLFRPLWFRTWRYVQLEIETKDDPLVLEGFSGKTYGYPFEEKASFKSSDPSHEKIWEVGWRTARLCAGENYFDCPYYEQLQYVGDTRIQTLISLYVSGDDRLMRKALLDFDNSRIPDGLTQSRYPCNDMQVIPTYSLFWISMIYDYWMHREDEAFLRQFQEGVEDVLEWHLARLDPPANWSWHLQPEFRPGFDLPHNAMLGNMEWWNFVDWSWAWNEEERLGGVPPGTASGGSSILTLQLAYTLQQASQLTGHVFHSDPRLRLAYLQEALWMAQATFNRCWDAEKQMLADTPEKKSFSQHANILAVLTDAVPKDKQAALLRKIVADTSITQTTFYFRFYLFEALKKTGLGDEFLPQLKDWQTMLDMGLTTFAENPEPTRSDCHAWSASPNYQFLSTVIGVNPGSPGFRTVRIEPFLGKLDFAEGKIPHPQGGEIFVRLEKVGDGLKAEVSLPAGVEGVFIWKGKDKSLAAGKQVVLFD